ncbi:MAG: hypothetical protein ACYC8T_31890 [Myxococcaceae bacterium]
MRAALLLCISLVVLACGSPTPAPDAGEPADSGSGGGNAEDGGTDAGTADGGGDAGIDAGSVQAETEPNNAGSPTEVNAFSVPGELTGAIDPADDLDIFTAQLTAGQFWIWELSPAGPGSTFVPHVAVAEHANVVPNLVAKSATAAVVTQEHFVLTSGRYNFIVRDARNLGSSQHVGGPGLTWRLRGQRATRTPTVLALPATVPTTLAHRQAVALYRFTLATPVNVDVQVLCSGKAAPSDMDPRLTLYNVTQNAYLQTNDDRSLSDVDSRLFGTLPAATYDLVIDNVSPTAADLSYELRVTTN